MTQNAALNDIRLELESDRWALRAAVDLVPPSHRDDRPAPDRWSVAEILEHLSIVESRVAGLLGPLAESAPLLAPGVIATRTPLDRTPVRNRANAVAAPAPVQPTGSMTCAQALSALERTRASLFAAMDSSAGRDLSLVTRQHPVLGVLDGYQWISAVGAHEERHALQIVEIAEQFNPNASSAGR